MAMTREQYREQLSALAPPGAALPTDQDSTWAALLDGLAAEMVRFDQRVDRAHEEADPRSTLELLSDWERFTGLPDQCSQSQDTLQERRAWVHAKVTAQGGQSKAYFKAQAEALGYSITVENFRPFVCGLSRCGDVLGGPPSNRYYWRVTVHGPRVTLFRCGASRASDKLGTISYAEDLECRLTQLQPGQGELIFAYQED